MNPTSYGLHQKGLERVDSASGVAPLVIDGAFGDQMSLFNGSVEFNNVDISVPGNSGLPVELRRNLSVRDRRGPNGNLAGFGEWDLDVPYLQGTFVSSVGWKVGPGNSDQRCSTTEAPKSTSLFQDYDFWDGYVLHMPGQGDAKLLHTPNPAIPAPGNGTTYPWITKSMWRISCKPTTANGYGGQGFIATSPDGIKYHLDWAITRETPALESGWASSGAPVLPRSNVYFVATRIEDVHGNWVNYAWSGAKLQSISSSDGRQISVGYTGYNITSATSSIGNWSYTYSNDALSGVTLPDGRKWSYASTGEMEIITTYLEPSEDSLNDCPNMLAGWVNDYSLAVTHPAGAKATFAFQSRLHDRSNVPNFCIKPTLTYEYWQIPHETLSFTLVSKTVWGPALPSMVWNYSYETAAGPDVPCTSYAGLCQSTKAHVVTGPNGTWTRSYFGMMYGVNEGKLIKEERGSSAANILRTSESTYVTTAQVPSYPFPGSIGTNPMLYSDPQDRELRPLKQTVITQQGVNFLQSVGSYDAFARPLSVTRSSTVAGNPSRTEVTQYHDNLPKWILGQVAKVTVGSQVPTETTYNADALPTVFKRFGKTYQTLAYNADATVASVKDGNNNTVALGNWYRGVPRTVTFPDTNTQLAEVSAAGWVTKLTDQNGYATTYTHDLMGRVASITQPTGDSVAWNPTTHALATLGVSELGMPVGATRQTISTGTGRRITYYDGLWRPLLTREYDTANEAATQRFQRFTYDHDGRVTFTGYPSASHLIDNGVLTLYDSLGRAEAVTEDSELGDLTTTTQYLDGFKTAVTNARGFSTTTTYQAFDTPTYDAPLVIVAPADTSTAIVRDVFGKPTSLTRSGPWSNLALSQTRSYVYDAQQRLCKTIDPETGATVIDYDAADNMAWSATGQSLTGPTCDRTSVPTGQRAVHTYDVLNRVTHIDYPAGAADLSYTYDLDGALKTATASAVGASPASTWTYTYNKRRLLTGESLNFDGTVSSITHGFDANASITSLTYPSGLGITYAPNALGQPTQAGTWATAVTYHRSGAIAGFTYGNGAVRTVTQTTRQWPDRIRDQRNGNTLFDHDLDYDETGNIEKITDGLPGGLESRTLTYDGRDRLVAVSNAPTGNETYAYDPLDHLRQAKLNGLDRRYTYNAKNQLDRIATQNDEFLVGYTWNNRGALVARSHPGEPGPHDLFRDGFEQGGDVLPPKAQPFVFDAANRLRSITGLATYTYDAHGHRLRTDRADGTRRTALYTRAGQLLEEIDTQTNQRIDYIALNGGLVAKRTRPINSNTATITYLHTDHRGTPAVDSSAAGQTTLRTRLSPYGLPYDNQWRNGPGLTGHITDADTQLSYMQQRYMDSGIFISPDPMAASAGSFDRYFYAAGNPYKFADPDGRREKVIGSNIPGNSVAMARVATTAAVAQVFDSGRVQFQNGATQSNSARQGATVVKDANKVGQMANSSGDTRFINAFNRIEDLVIDGRDFEKVAPAAIAFTTYGGNINFGEGYFLLNVHERIERFTHEAYHHDDVFYRLRLMNPPGCVGWSCKDEPAVEAQTNKFVRKNWNPEFFREE